LRRLAASLGIDERSLRQELIKLKKKEHEREKIDIPTVPEKRTTNWELRDELLPVVLGIEDHDKKVRVLEDITEADFKEPSSRSFYRFIYQVAQEEKELRWPQILNRLEDENLKQRLIALLSFDWKEVDKDKVFEDCLMTFKKRKLEKKLAELRMHIAIAERKGDAARVGVYVKEYQQLMKNRR